MSSLEAKCETYRKRRAPARGPYMVLVLTACEEAGYVYIYITTALIGYGVLPTH